MNWLLWRWSSWDIYEQWLFLTCTIWVATTVVALVRVRPRKKKPMASDTRRN